MLFKKEKVLLRRYQPAFITVDGKHHIGKKSDWLITNKLDSCKDYLMTDAISDGYIKEHTEDNMYIINNIISVNWEVTDEVEVLDTFREFQIRVPADDPRLS